MSAVTTPRLGCEFDRFLYASVGEDNNGMPLTVLSFPRDRVPPMLKAALAQAGPTKNPAVVSTLLTVMTFVIFIMLSQWLMGVLRRLDRLHSPPTPVPATESPSTPTSSEGLKNVK